MQAIQVKFIPATNHKGARLKAFCAAGSLTVDYHSIDANFVQEKEEIVANMLAQKLGWTGPEYGKLVFGQIKNGDVVGVFTHNRF